MNCEKCQTPAPESAAFCRQCGTALPAPVAAGGSSLTADEAAPGAAAKNECDECGAQLRPGAKFCASCGAVRGGAPRPAPNPPPAAPAAPRGRPRDAAVAPGADAQSRGEAERRAAAAATPPPTSRTTATAATTAAVATSAATTATTAAAAAKKVLIPSFPGRMVWSPRGSWRVSTRMSPSEIADLFESRMTKKANVLMRMNSYFRNVQWDVRRNAISEQIVATCKPTGIVTAGFGRSKIHVDVTGDTVVLQTSHTGEGPTQAAVGPGVFTTWLGLYMYPATVYAYDVVKAIKRADRDAVVTYPWSVSRIAGLALVMVGIVAAMLGAGGGAGSSGSDLANVSEPGAVVSPPPSPSPAPVDTGTDTTDDDSPSEPTAEGAFTSQDGYVVVPPEGWIRDRDSEPQGDGEFTESRWHLAGEPETYVLVNRTEGYDGEPGDGAAEVRASTQTDDDYEELGWSELEPSGWYWEFTIDGQRKIDVFSKACGDGYAALGAAPTAQFDTHRDTIVNFIESLAPPCGDATPSLAGVEAPSSPTEDPDTETTPDTQTTPDAQTTPTHSVSPEAARNSPTRVLRRFWQRLSAGEYDEAHGLLTASYQDGHPSWRDQQEAAQPVVNVVDIGPSTISGGVARVAITLYTRDRNLTEGSDTDCHRFVGHAKLVKEGSEWRYARDANRFEETVVDSAAPECNP